MKSTLCIKNESQTLYCSSICKSRSTTLPTAVSHLFSVRCTQNRIYFSQLFQLGFVSYLVSQHLLSAHDERPSTVHPTIIWTTYVERYVSNAQRASSRAPDSNQVDAAENMTSVPFSVAFVQVFQTSGLPFTTSKR
jgi:hypothetical protein